MRRTLIAAAVVGLFLFIGQPLQAQARGSSGSGSHSHSSYSGGSVSVHGYTRSNGTYVSPHHRSAPDGSFSNNWSTRGNVNPYTGKVGTLDQPSSTYGHRSGSYDVGSYAYSPSNSGENSTPISDTPRSPAAYSAVQSGTSSRSNPTASSGRQQTVARETYSQPQTMRPSREMGDGRPCIIKPVMADVDYYACDGNPPSYPYQYAVGR